MSKFDDLELMGPVGEVDDFLLQFCIKNKFPSLLASSIVLARLMWLNRQGSSSEDFAKLLHGIADGIDKGELDIPTGKNLH